MPTGHWDLANRTVRASCSSTLSVHVSPVERRSRGGSMTRLKQRLDVTQDIIVAEQMAAVQDTKKRQQFEASQNNLIKGIVGTLRGCLINLQEERAVTIPKSGKSPHRKGEPQVEVGSPSLAGGSRSPGSASSSRDLGNNMPRAATVESSPTGSTTQLGSPGHAPSHLEKDVRAQEARMKILGRQLGDRARLRCTSQELYHMRATIGIQEETIARMEALVEDSMKSKFNAACRLESQSHALQARVGLLESAVATTTEAAAAQDSRHREQLQDASAETQALIASQRTWVGQMASFLERSEEPEFVESPQRYRRHAKLQREMQQREALLRQVEMEIKRLVPSSIFGPLPKSSSESPGGQQQQELLLRCRRLEMELWTARHELSYEQEVNHAHSEWQLHQEMKLLEAERRCRFKDEQDAWSESQQSEAMMNTILFDECIAAERQVHAQTRAWEQIQIQSLQEELETLQRERPRSLRRRQGRREASEYPSHSRRRSAGCPCPEEEPSSPSRSACHGAGASRLAPEVARAPQAGARDAVAAQARPAGGGCAGSAGSTLTDAFEAVEPVESTVAEGEGAPSALPASTPGRSEDEAAPGG